jgi:hypothetical protein
MPLTNLNAVTEFAPNFNQADTGVLTSCLVAASDVIERYCNRKFQVTTYDELLDGTGYPNLLLTNYPLISITQIVMTTSPVVMIRNTNTTTASAATFSLDAVNLYLNVTVAGITTTNTITLASNLTLGNLATAISAAGNGWMATALGIYSNWPTSKLRPPQGAFDVRWGAGYLELHTFPLWTYSQNAEIGEIVSPIPFLRGYKNVRAIYQAGYATVPSSIQQACCELTILTYNFRNVNANLSAESLGQYSYTQMAEKSFDNLSLTSKEAIGLHKNRRIAKFKLY